MADLQDDGHGCVTKHTHVDEQPSYKRQISAASTLAGSVIRTPAVFEAKTVGKNGGKSRKHAEDMNFNQVFFRQLFQEEVSAQRESLTGGRAGDANHPHAISHKPSNKPFFVISTQNGQNNLKYCTREHTLCHYLDF